MDTSAVLLYLPSLGKAGLSSGQTEGEGKGIQRDLQKGQTI